MGLLPRVGCWALLALVLTFTPIARADEIGVLVEHIELDAAEATRLLHAGRPGRDATALRATVGKLVASGEAQVIDLAYAHGHAGEENKAGSLHEFLYPSAWDPAEVPSEIEAPVSAKMDLKVPANPTGFHDRALGNSLTAKAELREDGAITLAITSEIAELLPRKPVGARELGIEMPNFGVRKLSGEFTCRDRRPILAGVFTPRAADRRDRRVMIFATVSLRKAPPKEEEKEYGPLEDPFAGVSADDGPGEPEEIRFGVQCGVEYVEIPRGEVAGLVASLPADFEDESNVRDTIDRLTESGAARLLGSANLSSTAGQRARVQPIHEFIYPTEYEPPSVVPKLTEKVLAEEQPLITPSSPSAFVVRFLGLSVTAEPGVRPDRETVSVTLDADRVRHLRSIKWGIEESEAEQPLFEKVYCKSEIRLRRGEEVIAAILTPRDEKNTGAPSDRCVVILLWADFATAKPGE